MEVEINASKSLTKAGRENRGCIWFPKVKAPCPIESSARQHLFPRLAFRGCDDLRLIRDYLGLCAFTYTGHYTHVAGCRFEGLWR